MFNQSTNGSGGPSGSKCAVGGSKVSSLLGWSRLRDVAQECEMSAQRSHSPGEAEPRKPAKTGVT